MTGTEVEVGDSWAVDRLNRCERNIPNVNKKCSSMGKRQALQVQSCKYSSSLFKLLVILNLIDFASTKSHASGKIKNRYFRIFRLGSDVFFDADSDAPHMT